MKLFFFKMKKALKIFCFCLLLFTAEQLCSQVTQPTYPDSLFTTYYHQRTSLFRALPQTKNDIIFLGNSITDGGEWTEMFADLKVKNRGISGDVTSGVLNRLDEVYARLPDKVFLLIGINDLARNITPDSVVKNILWINALIKEKSPQTKLYIQSLFPVNEKFGKFEGHTSKKAEIIKVNKLLFDSASRYGYNFIDVFSTLVDSTGRMRREYTNDGLHLTGTGYMKWKEVIYNKVYDLPSLIPLPQKIKWTSQKILLKNYTAIILTQNQFKNEAVLLQQYLAKKNIRLPIRTRQLPGEKVIELKRQDVITGKSEDEAYQLTVSENKILFNATTAHGFFNALQTFKQLTVDAEVSTCEIIDWPAFTWRGFMVDVGRNYQSVQQLKQQISVMAAYKLNIFHLHLTEDIAWRLQSKQYPQLTGSKYMIRNEGRFYSVNELKDLITYCKARFITLIPEIDMPGHSKAFERALGVDMQSEAGVTICKNILTELCKELDVPYIHIGGDEVKITNSNFLQQMISLLRSLDKKVIAWNPGGNVPKGTILQMWNGNTKPTQEFPAIDSRHLYLNHFDPLEAVVAIFNHKICDTITGDDNKLGAILCNWPDRRIEREEDAIRMNAVYPSMLAFSERCWQGGGWKNYVSDFGSPVTGRYNAFAEFENRLLKHQQQYFKKLSFPYVKQSNIEWKLIGPFKNNGKTDSVFFPEANTFTDTAQMKNYTSEYGGTIILRHFWDPIITAHLKHAADSTTWYAIAKVWCDKDEEKNCWLGFNNISRSPATDSPPVDKWDNKNSAIWLNGKLILPPQWKRGGQKGNAEIPLTDEGYEYRTPTKIFFKKGWNTILIKTPVASFKGSDWQNPVKWMFTFVILSNN
jgi:lysophospholipase L1-like esterase